MTKASHKVSEEIYKKATAQQAAGAGAETGTEGNGTQGHGGKPGGDENVVDADFEEVKR